MVLAILIGVVCGVVGFVPLLVGATLARKAAPASKWGQTGSLLLGLLFSFIVLAIALVLCVNYARDMVLPFAIALVLSLTVSAMIYGVSTLIKKK